MPILILASASPRRKEYLALLDLPYECDAADVDETVHEPLCAADYAMEVAKRKAKAVLGKHKNSYVLGADTVVVYDGLFLGKPKDEEHAFQMLSLLQGHSHEVYTGICLYTPEGKCFQDYRCTKVSMACLRPEEIWAYINTKEPMDKAGAYGIQGRGAALIEKIDGCYFNVVGLPIHATKRLLKTAGYPF